MGSFTNYAENALLNLLLKNTAWANIGDAGGLQPSTAAGSFYAALFTVDPGEAGGGTECAYTSYARVAINRGAGFSVTDNVGDNAAKISFPQATGGSETAVSAAIFDALTGGNMIWYGDLSDDIPISAGTIPEIPLGEFDINMD